MRVIAGVITVAKIFGRKLLHITLPDSTCPPREVGERVTDNGFKRVRQFVYPHNGRWGCFRNKNGEPVYTGIFFDDGLHVTYHHSPGKCIFPQGIDEGDFQQVTVIGEYNDGEAHCFVIRLPNGSILQRAQ